jgi:hypothetical protein
MCSAVAHPGLALPQTLLLSPLHTCMLLNTLMHVTTL